MPKKEPSVQELKRENQRLKRDGGASRTSKKGNGKQVRGYPPSPSEKRTAVFKETVFGVFDRGSSANLRLSDLQSYHSRLSQDLLHSYFPARYPCYSHRRTNQCGICPCHILFCRFSALYPLDLQFRNDPDLLRTKKDQQGQSATHRGQGSYGLFSAPRLFPRHHTFFVRNDFGKRRKGRARFRGSLPLRFSREGRTWKKRQTLFRFPTGFLKGNSGSKRLLLYDEKEGSQLCFVHYGALLTFLKKEGRYHHDPIDLRSLRKRKNHRDP